MSAQWKKFEGTQGQLDEMKNAPHGWIVRLKSGDETFPEKGEFSDNFNLIVSKGLIDRYLICEPLPHAEVIAKHAMTGQPVYCYDETHKRWRVTHDPGWYKEHQYSLNPSREKEFIEVREYVCRDNNGYLCIGLVENSFGFKKPMDIEEMFDFVKWIDQDWRRIEI